MLLTEQQFLNDMITHLFDGGFLSNHYQANTDVGTLTNRLITEFDLPTFSIN